MRPSHKNEFWGALLEKAYAKLHGSYKAIIGGRSIDAALDFTGGVTQRFDLLDDKKNLDEWFDIMIKAYKRNAFISCSLVINHFVNSFLVNFYSISTENLTYICCYIIPCKG